MNPCPCGYFNDKSRECMCTPPMIQRYVSKVSGPLLDRIDIHIEVPAVQYKELRGGAAAEGSEQIRERVLAARERQHERFGRAGETDEGVGEGGFAADVCELADEYAADTDVLRAVVGCGAAAGAGDAAAGVECAGA